VIFEEVIKYVGFGIFSAKVGIGYADCFVFDQSRNDQTPSAPNTISTLLISEIASIKS
jgi:hypothetical protein